MVITNDGATILKHMAVLHPAARMVSCPCSASLDHRAVTKQVQKADAVPMNSWSSFRKRRISKQEMELPVWSCLLVVCSEPPRSFSLRVSSYFQIADSASWKSSMLTKGSRYPPDDHCAVFPERRYEIGRVPRRHVDACGPK